MINRDIFKRTKVKQKLQKMKTAKTSFGQRILISALLLVASAGFVVSPYALAENYSSEISRLQAENARNEEKVEALEDQAVGYEDAIKKLAAKIANLQAQIDESTRQQRRLEREIADAEKELDRQKNLLGQNIRSMYLEGDISTLEMLAVSKDLSEFVDKEQYRSSVQDKIKDTLEKINALKLKLKTQKEAVDLLLKQQTAKRAQLDSSRQEQQSLLSYNQSQINAFNEKTEKNRQRIDELIAAQRRANFNPDGGYYFIRFPGAVRDFNPNAYPYRNAGFSMQLGACSSSDSWPDSPDQWGYCTRQCVSYTAWAVEASGRTPPMYWGNARDWVANAYANGIPVYRSPQPGDIAISTSGYWGHSMYVESVNGGNFTTSEYNTYLDGNLTYQTRSY